MGGLYKISSSILHQAERRVEVTAQNVANIATPGYKKRISFADAVRKDGLQPSGSLDILAASDMSQGKLVDTASPYDLALSGSGFFVVRAGDEILYTRNGQFTRDRSGRLLTPDGFALQTDAGRDLVLREGSPVIAADGAVVQSGELVARVAVVDCPDHGVLTQGPGGAFSAPAGEMSQIGSPSISQGMLEASNVSTGDEMVTMMAALRSAETGQRLISVYDDLMGRVLTTFGQV